VPFLGSLAGALIGAIFLSLFSYALDASLRPKIAGSDMNALRLLFTVPGGIFWGGQTGFVMAFIALRKYQMAGWASLTSGVMDFCLLLVPYSVTMRGKWHMPKLQEIINTLRFDSFVFWLLLLWSLWLLLQGLILLQKIPKFQSSERYSAGE